MSDGGWDDEDFEPPAPTAAANDKWDGEDEGEDVKDAWDAEEDKDKNSEGQSEVKAVQRKKKKPLAERIAEKEAARQAEEAKEKEENREKTKEEKYAEVERMKKIQEHADLKLAKEAFGIESTGIDSMFPVTEEEFVKFRDALKGKISSFNTSTLYGPFLEKLIQDLVIDLGCNELKKISTTTSSIFHEKQKLQKEVDKKKKKKGKGTINIERDSDFGDLGTGGGGGFDNNYYDEDFI